MATREELAVIKAARAGESRAQLVLGARYLHGGNGLPRSSGTAFYWLRRAAQQGVDDAWLMIGRNISYEQIMGLSSPSEAAVWYEKAFEAGVTTAGLTFARLVLDHTDQFDDGSRARAMAVLSLLASRDEHQAQWLLAQQGNQLEEQLTRKAADAGVEQAQYALLDKAWKSGDDAAFAQGAAPLVLGLRNRNAAALVQIAKEVAVSQRISLTPEQAELLCRFAQRRLRTLGPDGAAQADLVDIAQLLELAALAGSNEARFELGLLSAKMDRDGRRVFMSQGIANFKKALRWLTLAGKNGCAHAWHALARIHSRSIYSQRNLTVAMQYLERAADMGVLEAQKEFAQISWRNRRDDPLNDVRSLYWWQRAAQQGDAEAGAALAPFAADASRHQWAQQAVSRLTAQMKSTSPFLCARVELAAAFGLSKPEALLLDIRAADYGHCLVVDICDSYARSKRRLVSIDTDLQRAVLNRTGRLFCDVDCSLSGHEGNYRQRQYRLRTMLPDLGSA